LPEARLRDEGNLHEEPDTHNYRQIPEMMNNNRTLRVIKNPLKD
jgi:hypothetical protein